MTASETTDRPPHYVFIAHVKDIEEADGACLAVQMENHTIALFLYNSKVYAIDNRCPHMGFPLSRGTVKNGVLTCHWHHARFDLMNGGTFDQWAGDVSSFPVQIRNENKEVWLDISHSSIDPKLYYPMLLQNGLRQNISLMIAKAVIAMVSGDSPSRKENKKEGQPPRSYSDGLIKAFQAGLEFGAHFKQSGWGQGLTIHTCMMNIIPYLESAECKAHALYHGLSAVAQDCASVPPRFEITPLPQPWPELSTLKGWFRQFIESRDAQGAERCIVTAVRLVSAAGADGESRSQKLSDILFAAATDHRFLDVGHTLDFTNKALEALDIVGWDNDDVVESVLSSLVVGYATAERMEESNSWRHPIDLVAIVEKAFKKLQITLENAAGKIKRKKWDDVSRDNLVAELLGGGGGDISGGGSGWDGDNQPQSIVDELLGALSQGASEVELSGAVAYAAALRIAQFHTRNEFGDWDAVLHTFTFANAVNQGLRRNATPELLRGVFDAALRIYLNRFLNVPPAKIPKPKLTVAIGKGKSSDNNANNNVNSPEQAVRTLLNTLPDVLDKRQQTNQAGQLVSDYLYNGGSLDLLLALLGSLLLREDRNFHSIQMVDAAFIQLSRLLPSIKDNDDVDSECVNILVAAARYLAAHSPTMRSQARTFQIGNQLYHGKHLFEEAEEYDG
jgi:nitrite reductase/ring-hydroxylating ferredoxin subunit